MTILTDGDVWADGPPSRNRVDELIVLIASLTPAEVQELRRKLWGDGDPSGDREPREPVVPTLSGGVEAELDD